MPTSRAKARAKLRSLMCARSASAGTERSASRLSAIQACSSRSGRRSAGCAVSWALNCAWPPGRLTNSTSQRAVVERHLAAEVLLDQREREVHPGGHAGRGVHVAVAHEDRVGVHLDVRVALGEQRAARPVRGGAAARRAGPAAASRNAPVQTPSDPARAPRQPRSGSSGRAARRARARTTPVPPATISVSIGPRQRRERRSGTRLTAEALSGPALGRDDLTS